MTDYIGVTLGLLSYTALIAGVVMSILTHRRSKLGKKRDNIDTDKHLPGAASIVHGGDRTFFDRFDQTKIAEDETTSWLSSLGPSYVIFTNLIIPNGADGDTTEIDHVVVSRYGIFCIETKSHHGNIYGYRKSKNWKQYIGNEVYYIHNPLLQNYKHSKALETLINHNLKSKIHSYVVFPYIHRLKVDSNMVYDNAQDIVSRIAAHHFIYYSFDELRDILRILAIYSGAHRRLNPIHIDNVQRIIQKET